MSEPAVCFICADIGEDNSSYATYVPYDHAHDIACERCGEYRVFAEVITDGLATHRPKAAKRDWALRLSNATRTASDRGRKLFLTHDSLKDIVDDAAPEPRTAGEYFDRVLQVIGDACRSPGAAPPVGGMTRLAARSGVRGDAFMSIVSQLRQSNLVGDPGPSVERFSCSPTIEGWRRLDDLTRSRPQTDRAFIAMWFADEMRDARAALRGAFTEAGYQPPFLVDDRETDADPETKSKIDDRIIAMIRRARFVVCDFTGHRQSVYYEAGYAEALGTPVIWCCRKDQIGDLAFDTRQHAHILWETPPELGAAVAAKIEAKGWRLAPAR